VPYLQTRYGGKAPERVGLKHPSIAPYGAFTCADGRDIVISIQNEREWQDFCREVLHEPDLPQDPRACDNDTRVANRDWIDAKVAEVFASLSSANVVDRLTSAQTAYGSVNGVNDLIAHPQLRTRRMPVGNRVLEVPALPWCTEWEASEYQPVPRVNEHGPAIRAEFADNAPRKRA